MESTWWLLMRRWISYRQQKAIAMLVFDGLLDTAKTAKELGT